MISLFQERDPGLFSSAMFCDLWVYVFNFVVCFSIFLVMLLSVTRAISITLPFYQIKTRTVLFTISVYVVLVVVRDLVAQNLEQHVYRSSATFCAAAVQHTEESAWVGFSNTSLVIQIAVPSLSILISFVISAVELYRSSGDQARQSPQQLQSNRASKTIAIFTAVFLVCNTPYFLNISLMVVTQVFYPPGSVFYPAPFHRSPFMFWYSWCLSGVVCVVLNATVNPCLYYCRMVGFAPWIRTWFSTQNNIQLSRGSTKRTVLEMDDFAPLQPQYATSKL